MKGIRRRGGEEVEGFVFFNVIHSLQDSFFFFAIHDTIRYREKQRPVLVR